MPFQVIIGEKNLSQGKIEIKERRGGGRTLVPAAELLTEVRKRLA
jgi:histidyl-tRNA synthetase